MPLAESISPNRSKEYVTKYRIISNGIISYLQYHKQIKFLFFIKYKVWAYIWNPYYNKISGRFRASEFNLAVNNTNNNLIEFAKTWGYINDYFTWATEKQKKLEQEAKKFREEKDANKKKIIYL